VCIPPHRTRVPAGERRRLFPFLFAVLLAAATLLLAEAFLRVIRAHGPALEGTWLQSAASRLKAPELSFWEQRFFDNYERGVSEMVFQYNEGLHRSHPTRGWTPKPNVKTGTEIEYTTNSRGFRSLHEFEDDPKRFQVIVVGDSFTYGDEVGDWHTWPQLLQQMDHRLNVMNMAVTGYGIDQMYLTLSEALAEFSPQLVIAGFIGDDLNRSLLAFRDYKKPRFLLDAEGGLELTNTPIGTPVEVYRELQGKVRRSRFEIINLLRSIGSGGTGVGEETPSWFLLNETLFTEMERITRERGGEFLMLYLPSGPEMVDSGLRTPGESFFEAYRERHGNLFLNLRPAMLQTSFEKSEGHYGPEETRWVSRRVLEFIRRSSSWRRFEDLLARLR
jgi:hypothetical protein